MRSRGITFYKGFKPDIMHQYTVLETRRILTFSVLQCNKLIINHLMINPYNSCHFDQNIVKATACSRRGKWDKRYARHRGFSWYHLVTNFLFIHRSHASHIVFLSLRECRTGSRQGLVVLFGTTCPQTRYPFELASRWCTWETNTSLSCVGASITN